ncbi:adenosine deaminase-like [Leptinotarsa decemlineata]|uniref:adenosine deaminase-like n=1 Tax=Leptinotarsa decemlineata TaxID=7539 RepID=UPI003D309E11
MRRAFEVLFLLAMCLSSTQADYWKDRAALLKNDAHHAMGASLKLNEKEKKVNELLKTYKHKEYDSGFAYPESFLAAQHFFQAKEGIEQSKVFNLIKKLPKGASLHSHDLALVSQEFLFNLTYRENLYACFSDDKLKLHFFDNRSIGKDCNWTRVSELRRLDPNFDNYLRSKLSLVRDDPAKSYPDLNTAWKSFIDIFVAIENLVAFKPVWQEYFYQVLKELYEDNVMYLEFRGYLPEVYDLNGRTYDAVEAVGLYYDTMKKFQQDYPDFLGAKFIYAPSRRVNNNTLASYVYTFRKLKKKYANFVAGFDLVGQEDKGMPLSSFVTQLKEMKLKYGANFFFHAGETNWYGESTDFNLFDAILLNTTRIGHGYALLKHPLAMKMIKEKNIAVEICPISNQVLKLVDDIRNHPGALLIANNFPVVVAPDDPSFWGAKGLSYDWYYAFMGMTSRESDLRFLKQLAKNSIEFSTLNEEEKVAAFGKWENDWNSFIDKMLGKQCPKDLQDNLV